MVDLIFEADFNDLQLMRRELVGVSKDAQKSAGVFEREYRKVERQLVKTAQANQAYFNEVLKIDRATKSASSSAQIFEKDIKRQEAAVERLSLKYKPLFASSKQYERSLDELSQAHKLGVLSTKQHENAVEQLTAEYQQFVNGTAGWSNQFVKGSNLAGRSANRMGMVAQQAGFQVGDFLVQVQSGANPMVAFGQQATQLVGVLGFMNPKLIGIGAALGILIPLLTAVGAWWLRSSEAADKASNSAETFEDKLKSARTEVQGMADDLELLRSGFKNAFEKTLNDAVDNAQRKLKQARRDLEVAEASAGAVEGQRGQAFRDRKRVEAAKESLFLAKLELEAAKELVRQKREQERSEVDLQAVAEARRESYLEEQESVRKVAEEIQQGFRNSLGPAQTLRNETEAYIKSMSEVFKRTQDLKEELGEAAFEALRLADVDLTSGISSAAKAAAVLAGNLGISLNAAISLQNLRSGKVYSGRGGDPRTSNQQGFGSVDAPNIQDIIDNFNKRNRAGGGSSRNQKEQITQQEFLDNLRKEIEIKRRLIDLSENEREIQERVIELQQRAEKLGLKIGQDTLERLAKEEQQIRRLQQAQETYTGIVKNSLDSLLDGATSVEDAFIGMIRNILKELAQEHITGPISDTIGGILGKIFPSASGNVFSNGSIQPFANGGVVSSATLFPMRNGTGLMGESGPEAIMPLRRGSDGKLGVQVSGNNQQPIVIHQNFQFSANGDESVKKIIAQEAPRIAQLTQKKILDSRARGGAFKSTFG